MTVSIALQFGADLETIRAAIKRGDCRSNAGDGGRFDVALINLADILR